MPYNQYTGEYYDVTSRGTNDLVCLTVMLSIYNDSSDALRRRATDGTIVSPRMASTAITTAISEQSVMTNEISRAHLYTT